MLVAGAVQPLTGSAERQYGPPPIDDVDINNIKDLTFTVPLFKVSIRLMSLPAVGDTESPVVWVRGRVSSNLQ